MILTTVSRDCVEVIFVNYLEKVEAITGAHFASLLHRLKTEMQEKTPDWPTKKSSTHQLIRVQLWSQN